MRVGDLVQAKGEPVLGIIIGERRVQMSYPAEGEEFDVNKHYDFQYLVRWTQPPGEVKLLYNESWRPAKRLTLLSNR